MNEQMEFPETFERFAKEYGFKDDKEVYTNGSDLIPVFRVEQWLEYDNKLRKIETDTAYECGKHANKWIPVSERLPEERGDYLVTQKATFTDYVYISVIGYAHNLYDVDEYDFADKKRPGWYEYDSEWGYRECDDVIAWMPLPEPYKAESEDKE